MDNTFITSALALSNLILSSANVIITFSLLAYILTHNFRSPVARAFLALLSFMTIVHIGDVVVANIVTTRAVLPWLRFQWFGIAFVPAAYLQLSDALLRTTGSVSRGRRMTVYLAYVISAAFCGLAAFSDLVVEDGAFTQLVVHLAPGSLFWTFAVYFGLTTMGGLQNISQARRRCLTSTSRRRMMYLGLASAAPTLGVFPYLLVIVTAAGLIAPNWIYFVSLLGNIGIAGMTVVMGYAVAYHGVLTPDRVIKHNMIHYMLRGPVVGIAIIALMLIVPQVERILGLPRDTVLIFTVIVGIVTFQVAINVGKPYIDRLIYRRDREELAWIQTLDQRLFTTTDLEQLLENILTTLSDLLRVRAGFVVVMEDHSLQIRVFCGPRTKAERFLEQSDFSHIINLFAKSDSEKPSRWYPDRENLVIQNGYWLLPLYAKDNSRGILGIMGVEARGASLTLSQDEAETVAELVRQAERALADTHLQQEIFNTLRRLGPEIEALQRLRGTQHYVGSGQITALAPPVSETPEYRRWVKDALSHYWGGVRMSRGPLLQLTLVQRALGENDGVPTKALRAVLAQAIERQRPSGERRFTAPEWLIYNILELRFIKAMKIKQVAQRLAISESDYYRKQRVAIAEVSRTLADMEIEALAQGN